MAINREEARALRASVGRALDPLYAARTGTLAPLEAVARAIAALHALDRELLAAGSAAVSAGPAVRLWEEQVR